MTHHLLMDVKFVERIGMNKPTKDELLNNLPILTVGELLRYVEINKLPITTPIVVENLNNFISPKTIVQYGDRLDILFIKI